MVITTKEVFSSEAAANKIMLIFFQKKKRLVMVRCQNRMNEMNGNFVVHNSASLDLEITIA